ncbi:hypothetical protein [Paenibacillus sp. ov031]|uniref:beta-xylosidase family glycoside hydrolase n=1 Tax=Paenibacillus sp. ov031 TaxID=1761879 RepID=UPI000A87451D|nr:hypothetical protein [Paenibacillus sp. ov031]
MDNGILWADYWSLAERPGHLRLKGFRPIKEGGFFRAGNTLSQRYLMTTGLQVDTKLDLAGMSDGLRAGLVYFNGGVNYAMGSAQGYRVWCPLGYLL